uniref:Uncharacterized protein n=1 Tax=Globodera rostochiensis TaxID=31243 RepID=A0A914GSL5_GLORO
MTILALFAVCNAMREIKRERSYKLYKSQSVPFHPQNQLSMPFHPNQNQSSMPFHQNQLSMPFHPNQNQLSMPLHPNQNQLSMPLHPNQNQSSMQFHPTAEMGNESSFYQLQAPQDPQDHHLQTEAMYFDNFQEYSVKNRMLTMDHFIRSSTERNQRRDKAHQKDLGALINDS